MHIKSPTARAPLCAAKPTFFVTADDDAANFLPAPSVAEPPSAFVIGMIWPNSRLLGTGVRTETAPALRLASKRAVGFGARLANTHRCGHESCVPAFPGAVPNSGIARLKGDSAHNALSHERARDLVGQMTGVRAETHLSAVLDNVTRALKVLLAVRANKGRPILHRLGMTGLAAEDRRSAVRAKLLSTLGAHLAQN